MTGLEAAAIVGTGTMVYGQISAAQAQADATRRGAEIKRMQAEELLQRQQINEAMILEQSEELQKSYGASFASTGREGAGLGGIMQIRKNTQQTLENTRRDAEFKAKMLRMGADIETELASDMLTAGAIGGLGTILTTGVQMTNLYRGPSTPKALPGTK